MNEQETKNLELVLEYLDKFGTFDPEQYHPYLAENPTYMRRAPTNKVEDHENIYGMFFEVRDGKIHTQVELLDFRVSTEMFDLTALERG